LLDDESKQVRWAAVSALGKMRPPALSAVLNDQHENWQIRAAAKEAWQTISKEKK
jgi:HEAT repeat protein